MKILLPVDGSDCTERMLNYIVQHLELGGCTHEYVGFTAVAETSAHVATFVDGGTLDHCHQDQAELILLPLKAFADRRGWKLRMGYSVGRAAEAIATFAAAEQPDLIVMGAHGHAASSNVVLGSVTQGVLARCKLPVLLIR